LKVRNARPWDAEARARESRQRVNPLVGVVMVMLMAWKRRREGDEKGEKRARDKRVMWPESCCPRDTT
jgi:hypothetical protein